MTTEVLRGATGDANERWLRLDSNGSIDAPSRQAVESTLRGSSSSVTSCRWADQAPQWLPGPTCATLRRVLLTAESPTPIQFNSSPAN